MARFPLDHGDAETWGPILEGWIGIGPASPPFFNPLDDTYGAVGDGVANDTAALQAALNAAIAAKGVLYLPRQFRVTNLSAVGDDVSIIGSARANAGLVQIPGTRGVVLYIEGDRPFLDNFTVDCSLNSAYVANGKNEGGIDLNGCANAYVGPGVDIAYPNRFGIRQRGKGAAATGDAMYGRFSPGKIHHIGFNMETSRPFGTVQDNRWYTTPLLDDFNRANEAPVLGPNYQWLTYPDGSLAPHIVGNQLVPNAGAVGGDPSEAYYTREFTSDEEVWIKVGALPTGADTLGAGLRDNLGGRARDGSNVWTYYFTVEANGDVKLWVYANSLGGGSQLGATAATSCAAGDVLLLTAVDDLLKVRRLRAGVTTTLISVTNSEVLGYTLTALYGFSVAPYAGTAGLNVTDGGFLTISFTGTSGAIDEFGGGSIGGIGILVEAAEPVGTVAGSHPDRTRIRDTFFDAAYARSATAIRFEQPRPMIDGDSNPAYGVDGCSVQAITTQGIKYPVDTCSVLCEFNFTAEVTGANQKLIAYIRNGWGTSLYHSLSNWFFKISLASTGHAEDTIVDDRGYGTNFVGSNFQKGDLSAPWGDSITAGSIFTDHLLVRSPEQTIMSLYDTLQSLVERTVYPHFMMKRMSGAPELQPNANSGIFTDNDGNLGLLGMWNPDSSEAKGVRTWRGRAADIALVGNTLDDGEGNMEVTGYIDGPEIADPAAPAANAGRFYFRDNGAGKTQLVVRFPTGPVQVISTEP